VAHQQQNGTNDMMRTHTVEVSESLWKYFQAISGKTMPGNAIREALHEYRVNHPLEPADNIVGAMLSITTTTAERRRALDLQPDPVDHQFNAAYQAFVVAHDLDEDAALAYLENAVAQRGIKQPRAWLMDWWKNLPVPQAVES
jgi:hypothetical protein